MASVTMTVWCETDNGREYVIVNDTDSGIVSFHTDGVMVRGFAATDIRTVSGALALDIGRGLFADAEMMSAVLDLIDTTVAAPRETTEIDICTDCMMMLANGDDSSPRADDAPPVLGLLAGMDVVPGDGTDDFSTRPCAGCGDTLAGTRHGAVIFD